MDGIQDVKDGIQGRYPSKVSKDGIQGRYPRKVVMVRAGANDVAAIGAVVMVAKANSAGGDGDGAACEGSTTGAACEGSTTDE